MSHARLTFFFHPDNMKSTKRSRFSQRSRGETSDMTNGQAPRIDACRLPVPVEEVRPRSHGKLDHSFLTPETALAVGSQIGSKKWASLIEHGSEMQGTTQNKTKKIYVKLLRFFKCTER